MSINATLQANTPSPEKASALPAVEPSSVAALSAAAHRVEESGSDVFGATASRALAALFTNAASRWQEAFDAHAQSMMSAYRRNDDARVVHDSFLVHVEAASRDHADDAVAEFLAIAGHLVLADTTS